MKKYIARIEVSRSLRSEEEIKELGITEEEIKNSLADELFEIIEDMVLNRTRFDYDFIVENGK